MTLVICCLTNAEAFRNGLGSGTSWIGLGLADFLGLPLCYDNKDKNNNSNNNDNNNNNNISIYLGIFHSRLPLVREVAQTEWDAHKSIKQKKTLTQKTTKKSYVKNYIQLLTKERSKLSYLFYLQTTHEHHTVQVQLPLKHTYLSLTSITIMIYLYSIAFIPLYKETYKVNKGGWPRRNEL